MSNISNVCAFIHFVKVKNKTLKIITIILVISHIYFNHRNLSVPPTSSNKIKNKTSNNQSICPGFYTFANMSICPITGRSYDRLFSSREVFPLSCICRYEAGPRGWPIKAMEQGRKRPTTGVVGTDNLYLVLRFGYRSHCCPFNFEDDRCQQLVVCLIIVGVIG